MLLRLILNIYFKTNLKSKSHNKINIKVLRDYWIVLQEKTK